MPSSSLDVALQLSLACNSRRIMLAKAAINGMYPLRKPSGLLWYVTRAEHFNVLGSLTFPKLENIPQILYCPTMFAAKLALLLQMMRMFKGNRRDSVYWSIQVLIWTNLIFYTTLLFCFIFACVPRMKLQDPTTPGHCISTKDSILAASFINIASDFTILLLPVYAIWKLKIALKRKIAIAAVFSTGLL